MPSVFCTDGYVTVSGLRLHYVDYGGAGHPVVALPGLIQNARAFDSIAPLLVPRVRLIALDFRGRGESDWGPAERYRIDQYLKDFKGFLAALGLERIALIGTSLGGFVARLYATAHPERVTHLVLNDCAIGGNLAGVHRVSTRPSLAPPEFDDIRQAMDWFASDRPGLERLDQGTQRTWVEHYLTPNENGRLRFRCDPAVIKLASSMANHFTALQRSSVETALAWEQAKRLTMPVLILRGALSEVIPTETVDRLTKVLPQARCVDIRGVSHSPTLYEEEAQAALREFFEPLCERSNQAGVAPMIVEAERELEIGGVSAASLAGDFGTPLYVYDADEIRRSFERIIRANCYQPVQIHYACVTNANLAIMRVIRAMGGGIHANTWGDALMALRAGFAPEDIVYSGSNITGEDFCNIFSNGVAVNLNSLSQLRQYAMRLRALESQSGRRAESLRRVGLRIHLEDKMPYSRMGVKVAELDEAQAIAAREDLRIVGVHYYRGTGTIHIKHFLEPFPFLMEVARRLGETIGYVDVGGGFGYPYIPGGPDDFDWEYFGGRMSEMLEELSSSLGKRIRLILEPGRSVVASSGFLLTRVVGVDRRAAGGQVAGVDTTVSHISTETFRVYGGYRRIALASRPSDEPPVPTDVVGCTTFSDDYIGRAPRNDRSDRGMMLPPLREGDLLAVLDAGGYGFAFASNFLNKPRPAEVMVDGGAVRLVRRRETYEDMLRLQSGEASGVGTA